MFKKFGGGFRNFTSSVSIGTRFAIGAIVCAVLVCAASLAITVSRTEAELSRLGMAKIDQDMRTLWAFGLGKGSAHVEDGKLMFGDYVANGNHEVVDKTKEVAGGGTATIFQLQGDEFVRVTTNVPGTNGGRAVGTKLARNGAY